ncbi:ATP-dependent RNA helicase [Phaffia rhodozyma]|uniref:RNA helicase n=1 Tax=Phaffia rhodozyma TaxID=264483 RepID=A0A0F7SEY7_PHARH|nr:ATP-dependent RNA helicase [Phaffia rhodozyma]
MSVLLARARVPAARCFSTCTCTLFPRFNPLSPILSGSETQKSVEDIESTPPNIRTDDMEFRPTTSLSEFTLSRAKPPFNSPYFPPRRPPPSSKSLQERMKGKINIGKLMPFQQEPLDRNNAELDELSIRQEQADELMKQSLKEEQIRFSKQMSKREKLARRKRVQGLDLDIEYNAQLDIPTTKAKLGEDSLLVSGVRPVVAQAVRQAFPKFKELTDFQQEFIQRIISRGDVVGRDSTGQGKTFALLLALLSLPRTSSTHITSVLIVSSTSLANQIKQWASLIVPEAYLATSVGTLVVKSSQEIDVEEYRAILRSPPHILVATPNAIANSLMENALSLKDVQTIAIDEADAMCNIPSQNAGRRAFEAFVTKPPIAIRTIRRLFSLIQDQGRGPTGKPQMVICSATISNHFTNFITNQEAWVRPGANITAQSFNSNSNINVAPHRLKKPSSVDHHCITVSPAGSIRNTFSTTASPTEPLPAHPLPTDKDGKPCGTTAQPHMMEAFAQVYAMNGGLGDQNRSLLIVPDKEALKNAEFDLKDLGIRYVLIENSTGLSNEEAAGIVPTPTLVRGNPNRARNRRPKVNESEEKTGESEEKVASGDSGHEGGTFSEDPADTSLLYVATSETVRGLDIPSLSAVYIFSSSIASEADYTHFAGRLGRITSKTSPSKKGQVIILNRGDEFESSEAAKRRELNMARWAEKRKDEILLGQLDKTIKQINEEANGRFQYKDEEAIRLLRFTRNIGFVSMKGLE